MGSRPAAGLVAVTGALTALALLVGLVVRRAVLVPGEGAMCLPMGRPAAVLVPVDEYEALEETAEILSDEDTLDAIRRGLDDLAAGDLVPLDEVRAEHAARNRL